MTEPDSTPAAASPTPLPLPTAGDNDSGNGSASPRPPDPAPSTESQLVRSITQKLQAKDATEREAAGPDAPPPVVETINLTKVYKNLVAVNELNLVVRRGDLFGFIGPNGAGKTTTIKTLATLLRPTHGDALVCGYSVRKDSREIRRIIGYMPDFFGVYEEMRVTEYLEFFAAAYKIPPHKRGQIVNDVLDLTDLGYKRNDYVKALSRGMQQRLGVARVLLHDPQLLLLDEPASGLDPRARIEMRALLKELQRMGKTILISSHILTELAEMCNAIGIVERGQLLYQGPVRDIVKQLRRAGTFEIDVADRREAATAALERHPDVLRAELAETDEGDPFIRVRLLEGKDDPTPLVRALMEGGYALTMLKREELDLEDVFLQVTKGVVN
ncbi:MAG: ABC transporter ATP-binding protein [Planctomycetota bacterium]